MNKNQKKIDKKHKNTSKVNHFYVFVKIKV